MKMLKGGFPALLTGLLSCAFLAPVNSENVFPPGQRSPEKSPLVGDWASQTINLGDGPGQLHLMRILEDGTYHQVDLSITPEPNWDPSNGGYRPSGAALDAHKTGQINLETGAEKIPPTTPGEKPYRKTWSVSDHELTYYIDMGPMGGEAFHYYRIDLQARDRQDQSRQLVPCSLVFPPKADTRLGQLEEATVPPIDIKESSLDSFTASQEIASKLKCSLVLRGEARTLKISLHFKGGTLGAMLQKLAIENRLRITFDPHAVIIEKADE